MEINTLCLVVEISDTVHSEFTVKSRVMEEINIADLDRIAKTAKTNKNCQINHVNQQGEDQIYYNFPDKQILLSLKLKLKPQ